MVVNLINNIVVTIIVPVYQVEIAVLSKCLESICAQTYDNIELLVIQDGETEKYDSLMAEIIKLDARVSYYKIPHVGVSGARNYGLDHSTGSYIAFVDSDDLISSRFIEESLQLALESDAQVVCGELKKSTYSHSAHLSNHANQAILLDSPLDISLLKEEILSGCPINGHENLWMSVQGPVSKLYERSSIGNLRFDGSLSIGEDVHFNVRVLSSCNRVIISKNIWYFYNQREGSLCHSGSIEKWSDNIKQYKHLNGAEFNSLAVKARIARLATDMLYDSCVCKKLQFAFDRLAELDIAHCFSSDVTSRYAYPPHRKLLYSLLDKGLYGPSSLFIHFIVWLSAFKNRVR